MKNKQTNIVFLTSIIVIISISAGIISWTFTKKLQSTPLQPVIEQNITENKQIETQRPTEKEIMESVQITSNQDIYFGSTVDEKLSFVNVSTNTEKDLIPIGYEIVDQHNYKNNTQFLILKKSNQLYSFSIQTKSLQKIEDGMVKDDEEIFVYPSLTEQDKFYLVINTIREIEYDMYGTLTTSSRRYFLDTTTNKLTNANGVSSDDIGRCFVYDSKYTRFFVWNCGEGIGNTIPLSTYSLVDKKYKEIINASDFEGNDKRFINIQQGNENLLAMSKDKDDFSKIIVITPTEDIEKKTFSVTEKVRNQLDKTYPYSNLFIEDKKNIIVGGDNFILFMKFNNDNEIIESKYLNEREIYANFIFTDGQKIYYKAKNQLKIANLDTWLIEKTIPLEEGSEEINIFILPKQ